MREPRVITIWLNHYPTSPLLDETRAMADRFEQLHPGYHVEIEAYDFHDVPSAVVDAVRTGNQPTIAQIFYTSTQAALDMRGADGGRLFVPIEEAVAGRREILGEPVVLDDVMPAARGFYSHEGTLCSLPIEASTTLLYANRTMLDAAGVTEMPRTWAEVDAACAAVAALGNAPEHTITWPNHGWIFQQQVAQQGGLLADADNGRSGRARTVDLASKEMLTFVEWWRRLHAEGHYAYSGDIDPTTCWAGVFKPFAEQRVAFTVNSSVMVGHLTRAGERNGFAVEAGRFPYNDALPCAGNLIGGDSLWLTAGLDRETEDGALAFLQFLDNPENAAHRHRSTSWLPVTGAARELLDREGWFAEHPGYRVALDQLAASDGSPATIGALIGDFHAVQTVLTEAVHDILVTGADPLTRLTEATRAANAHLAAYDAHCEGENGTRRSPAHLTVS